MLVGQNFSVFTDFKKLQLCFCITSTVSDTFTRNVSDTSYNLITLRPCIYVCVCYCVQSFYVFSLVHPLNQGRRPSCYSSCEIHILMKIIFVVCVEISVVSLINQT